MSKTKAKEPWMGLFAGGVSGAVEASINYPTEFVKTQLQLNKGKYSGPIDCAKKTVAQHGVLGLYRGLPSLLTGTVFKASIRFGAYEKYAGLIKGDQEKLTTGQTMLTGLLTGATEAVIAVTPSETIKTKIIDDLNRPKQKYRGFVHGTATIIREEGFGGIYKGLSATIARQATNSMVRFTVYGYLKDKILTHKGTQDLALSEALGAGVAAGSINVFITMPLDVVKTRMQGLNASRYTSMFNCALTVVKEEGVLSLWSGTVPRLARLGPSGGIMFLVYEQTLALINQYYD